MQAKEIENILQQARGGRLDEMSKDSIDEGTGSSIQTFISGARKIPQMYRSQQVSLGTTIFLWLWMKERFDELEKRVDDGMNVVAREIAKLNAEREGQDKT
jgi:hypothetical protein